VQDPFARQLELAHAQRVRARAQDILRLDGLARPRRRLAVLLLLLLLLLLLPTLLPVLPRTLPRAL